MTVEKRSLGNLMGRLWDLREVESISALIPAHQTRRGVYRLGFPDGSFYVGQSQNVVRRFSDHRRRWEQIETLEFFPVPTGDLNRYEELLLQDTEREHSVRNIQLANKPRGQEAIDFQVREGESISLPWDRASRKTIAESFEGQAGERYLELVANPLYGVARLCAGWYIAETIPDPGRSVGLLWTVTALPSTSKNPDSFRLFSINIGNLESFVAYAVKHEGEWFCDFRINTAKLSEELKQQLELNHESLLREDHYQLTPALSWEFVQEDVLALLEDREVPWKEEFLDKSYELNVRLMRQGGGLFQRWHNQYLVSDLLNAAVSFIF